VVPLQLLIAPCLGGWAASFFIMWGRIFFFLVLKNFPREMPANRENRLAVITSHIISSQAFHFVRVCSKLKRNQSDGTTCLVPDNLPQVTDAIRPILGEYYNYDSTVRRPLLLLINFAPKVVQISLRYMPCGDRSHNAHSLKAKATSCFSEISMEEHWLSRPPIFFVHKNSVISLVPYIHIRKWVMVAVSM
jgi:hypothetical protein